MSQKEFGEKLGIVDSYVSELESDKKTPSLTLLLAMEHRYGVSAEWLKTGKGEKYIKEGIRLSDEEIKIIHALREQRELQKLVLLSIEQLKNRKEFIKKLTELLKIS